MPVVVVNGGSFDWSAVGIGAGFLLMVAAIGARTINARKSQRAGRLSGT